ncbi:putative lysyl-tRNA synthetase [Trypanosoma conorhini]|uniref:Lysine--tRNA ligase n=1 Tax=Trypanosoma conorhini TaxID=83891 RepID=A0A422PK31_9TRYP|nr:putative lysyl-tRNA synthetase [Trypanosoma conorhini]RNF18070.1 putative lysyl-tRNA synthetase [Trypanosoma conorhini]
MRRWGLYSLQCLCACLLSVSKQAAHAPSPPTASAPSSPSPSSSLEPERPQNKASRARTVTQAATRAPRTKLDLPAAYSSFRAIASIGDVREQYGYLGPGERAAQARVRVAGRVTGLRDMGKMLFLTISSDGRELQVVGQVGEHFTREELKNLKVSLRVGDIIGVEGVPCRMQRGELSVAASRVLVLSPYVCTDQVVCPNLRGFTVLQDNDVRYRYRFVDMMTNPCVLATIRKRHVMLQALREYLNERNFVEVETPVLHTVASGANAKPFVTHHNANGTDLFLRVAPELHLKQCIVGGMERVYEIGKVFRNEDADRTHNPEFTSCEFYAAYHTYEDLMPMTEDIFRRLATRVNGTMVVRLPPDGVHDGPPVEVDMGSPFRRLSVYDEVQRVSGVELPPPGELNTPKGIAYMSVLMLRHNIPLPPVRTAAKLFDKLIDFFVTDRIVEPTFVMDHPLFMSPLAKEHASRPGLAERFELFINGMEYCNAYSELNDPQEQYQRFQQQLVDRQGGDEEAMALDETFLKSLQVGLPPTAGWGMGVDRALMLLTNSGTIRDGIIFPLLREDVRSHDSKRRHKTASFFDFNKQMTLFCLSGLEQELKRNGLSDDACAHLRELRKTIVELGNRGGAHGLPMTGARLPEWRLTLLLSIIRFMCGPHRR